VTLRAGSSFRVTTILVVGAGAVACDRCGSGAGARDGSSSPDEDGASSSGTEEVTADAASVAVDAATACQGAAIDLAAAISDPACAITSGIAKSTRAVFEIAADAGKHSLRQEAVRLDDGRIEVRLVNKGTAAVALPLSWHPKIPAFVVLADNVREKAIYELDAPPLAVELDGGPPSARFARVTILPGGHAFARIAINPKIVRRAGKATADAGSLPDKIGDGKWTLHVGQLVTDVDTGEPASLVWLIEAKD
jgi:hypothetical protein